jgi:hypothetical protein
MSPPASTPRRQPALLLLTTSLAIGSCAEPSAPRVGDVIGTYEATTLMADGQDVLAAGGSLTLQFEGTGLTFGTLFVPASAGGPLTADMTGTWGLVDHTLIIDQSEDTFVRDAVWIWDDDIIDGTCCTASPTVTVRMERN